MDLKETISSGDCQYISITVCRTKPPKEIIPYARISGEVLNETGEKLKKLEEGITDEEGFLGYSWKVDEVGTYKVTIKVFEPNNPNFAEDSKRFKVNPKLPSS